MPQFDECAFLYALITRPEDCRRFSSNFTPEWLTDSTLVPICKEVFDFLKEHGVPPSIHTLRKVLRDKDEEAYDLRYRAAVDKVEAREPDLSDMLYTIGQAKDVAIIRSLQELYNSPRSLRIQANFEGKDMIRAIQRWVGKFVDLTDDETLTIKEAIDRLIEESRTNRKLTKIRSGIYPIDLWTNDGVKPKNMGIVLAPSAGGKSAVLINIAHSTSAFDMRNTWLITNEMCMEETTERMLARLSNTPMSVVEENPLIAYKGLTSRWLDLDKRLLLTYINRDVSFDEIEGEMVKWTNLTGWKPEVVVLDYLERMRPVDKGYSRDKEWSWLGAIARDAVRFAKRHRLLLWTAAQMNREALDAEIMQSSMMQSSIRHFQEAAVVVAVRNVSEDRAYDEGYEILEFWGLKFRQNRKPTHPIRVKADLERMVITNITKIEEPEDKEVPDVERKDNGKGLRKYKG